MKTNTKKALAIIASIALFINMDFVAPVFADTKTDDTTAVSISSNPTEATVDAVTGTEETEPAESNALPEGNDPLVIAQSDEVVAFDATAVTTDIHAVVAWVDEGDSGRPTNVVLHLQAGGTTVQTKTVTAADGWTTTFTADQFEADGTTPIIYSVAEDTVPAYKATYSIDSTTGDVTITNSLMDGNLDIGLAPGQNFRIRFSSTSDTMTAVLNYTPFQTGVPETVTVYLPPFFSLAATPANGTGYTVTSSVVNLPTMYYTEADAGILNGYASTLAKCTAVTFNFSAAASGQFALSLATTIDTAGYQNLSDVMVAYGKDPDKIPLKIIAEVKDAGGNRLDWKTFSGTSLITTADGSAASDNTLLFPSQSTSRSLLTSTYANSTSGFNYNNPHLFLVANPYMYTVSSWHYPYTDMYVYIPAPEKTTISQTGSTPNTTWPIAEYVYLDTDNDGVTDTRYAKTQVTQSQMINLQYLSGYANTLVNYYQITFPDMDTLLPGDILKMGNIYLDYTYKGTNYSKIPLVKVNDYTIPTYFEPTYLYGFLVSTSGSSYSNTATTQRRLQGQNGDKYQITVLNSDRDKPTYVYEDATITVDFPYEVSPTSIGYTNGQNGYENRTNIIPTSVSYYIDGDPTEYKIVPASGATSITFPTSSQHIVKVQFHYADILSASKIIYGTAD